MDAELTQRLLDALVGKPIVGNAFRGTLVEAILAGALAPDWNWCADGWGPFDFVGAGGVGLEVKQSAARQDWHDETCAPAKGRFDIAARKGRWEGKAWIAGAGRNARIYVFAWHPIFDPKLADHREPSQWQFRAMAATDLPDQKSISLSVLKTMAEPVGIGEIREAVARITGKILEAA